MKIKVCGMKYKDNIKSVAALQPDYLGFIFYDKSKRHFQNKILSVSGGIKKVGVFVNAEESVIDDMINTYNLNALQLHGDESASFCAKLRETYSSDIIIIKAFSISDDFDFKQLNDYMKYCDYFLFDTKGRERGGNGTLFDWNILEQYQLEKPYFLSGGIGPVSLEPLIEFLKKPVAGLCHAIDVNSRFESEPGMKKVEELKEFIDLITKEK